MTVHLTLKTDSANTYHRDPMVIQTVKVDSKEIVTFALGSPDRAVQVDLDELRRALDALSPP